MRKREIRYDNLHDQHKLWPDYRQPFTTTVIQERFKLEKLSQARSYVNWLMAHDIARVISDDGMQVTYCVAYARDWITKPWHPSSLLPKGYWNGVSSRGHWFNQLWIEGASA